jgi:L-threonylcarbamoyladenylate synthase
MKTLIVKVDPRRPDPAVIERAGEIIRRGGLVGFPTETVYGLAADVLNEEAARRVFDVKGRPVSNPLPVQVACVEEVYKLASEVPEVAARLMERFFPGPLTLVLNAAPSVSEIITAGTGKIGIRMPDHPVALALIEAAGSPIVAPSANTSGDPSPTTADEVLAYFDGRIEMILDAGPSPIQVASTVVDVTQTPPRILRQGVITAKMLSV